MIKHLLRRDLSKRYGNLKNGINDIKDHRFFESLSWPDLLAKKIAVDHLPKLEP
jgi:hypothetical protein